MALIRESDKPFLGIYYVQGAWRYPQAAWCMWARFTQKSERPSSSHPLHPLGSGQNTRAISVWKSHWGEGLCCCSRQEIWPVSLSLLITAQDWVRNIPIFTLDPKSSSHTHTQKAMGATVREEWRKTKLETDSPLWCWQAEVLKRFASE